MPIYYIWSFEVQCVHTSFNNILHTGRNEVHIYITYVIANYRIKYVCVNIFHTIVYIKNSYWEKYIIQKNMNNAKINIYTTLNVKSICEIVPKNGMWY